MIRVSYRARLRWDEGGSVKAIQPTRVLEVATYRIQESCPDLAIP
jgi:hypothetical protein